MGYLGEVVLEVELWILCIRVVTVRGKGDSRVELAVEVFDWARFSGRWYRRRG